MTYEDADAILTEFFAPLATDDFFREVGRTSFELSGGRDHPRWSIFGDDPKHSLLAGYATHATQLKCYGMDPTGPPPAAKSVASPEEFLALIRSFHERNYTVRIPDVIPLSPPLEQLTRAIETMLHQPVQTAMFWSKAETKAIVHYDNRDNIAVQLEGTKRWFISTAPAGLQ